MVQQAHFGSPKACGARGRRGAAADVRSPRQIGTITMDSRVGPGHVPMPRLRSSSHVLKTTGARVAHPPQPAGRRSGGGRKRSPWSYVQVVGGRSSVERAGCRRRRSADLAQLVADQVDDRLEVELRRDALLDAVDDRQLGVALLGLLEQALRLVEQAGALQRDAHRRGDGGQQPQLGLAKCVFALVVLHVDGADPLVADDDGYAARDSAWSVPGMATLPAAIISAAVFSTKGARRAQIVAQRSPESITWSGMRRRLPCSITYSA